MPLLLSSSEPQQWDGRQVQQTFYNCGTFQILSETSKGGSIYTCLCVCIFKFRSEFSLKVQQSALSCCKGSELIKGIDVKRECLTVYRFLFPGLHQFGEASWFFALCTYMSGLMSRGWLFIIVFSEQFRGSQTSWAHSCTHSLATGSLFKGDVQASLRCLGPAEVSQVPSKVHHPWPCVI